MGDSLSARDRIVGGLVGLAAGDALGVPVEFEPRKARESDPVTGMRGGGTWHMPPGTWSDDASLALCLAESIVDRGFDPQDSGRRSLAWLDEGLWTARGSVFDVGGATRRALDRIRSGLPAVLAGGRGENDNGNGSLMRILPAAAWLGGLPEPARFRAIASYSAVTHGHPRSLLGCWLLSLVASRLLGGEAPRAACEGAAAEARELAPGLPATVSKEAGAYARVLDGGLPSIPMARIRGSGYVVHCLEAALWCLATSSDFSSCVLAAVNLGEDADTTGAVAGGLAGLAYGRRAIPEDWAGALARSAEIEALAARLAAVAAPSAPPPGTYWVLPGKFLAGPLPGLGRKDAEPAFEALAEAGVDALLELRESGEAGGDQGYALALKAVEGRRKIDIAYDAAPMPASGAGPDSVSAAVAALDGFFAAGKTVYAHCQGGTGRTGAVAAAYLVERGLAQPDAALAVVDELRARAGLSPVSPPKPGDPRGLVAGLRPGPSALPLH
jgi:ADP-ribosyl-[dinitrogen reductase] hydrolase